MNGESWVVVTGDFVPTGGMDRANMALAQALALGRGRAGEKVDLHLVAHRRDPSVGGDRVRFHQVPRPAGKHALGAPLLDGIGRFWAHRVKAAGKTAADTCVVVVNGGNCLAPATVNWVHYVHAAYPPSEAWLRAAPRWRRWWYRDQLRRERLAFGRAKVLVANSERTRQDLLTHYGAVVSPERVVTVYYGSDPLRLGTATPEERHTARQVMGVAPHTPVALFVGALGDDRKGFATLFDAWGQLQRERGGEGETGLGWDGELWVVGSGQQLPIWQARAKEVPWGPSLRFLGFRTDVPQLLAAADLLVSPVRYEAYGLNLQEAICRGRPILTSRHAGAAERLPPVWGPMLLDRPDDAQALAHALRRWSQDPAFWQRAAWDLSPQWLAWTWTDCAQSLITHARAHAHAHA